MQCVGTLRWSDVGMAVPPRHPHNKSLTPTAPPQPQRRTMEAPEVGARVPPAAAPATRLPHVEVSPLETDWSQIVRQCMDGDSGAWAELVRTHHRRVYGLCYRFTGNQTDAEDLTQDVFLKVYR